MRCEYQKTEWFHSKMKFLVLVVLVSFHRGMLLFSYLYNNLLLQCQKCHMKLNILHKHTYQEQHHHTSVQEAQFLSTFCKRYKAYHTNIAKFPINIFNIILSVITTFIIERKFKFFSVNIFT
jgi:hypothetical protein